MVVEMVGKLAAWWAEVKVVKSEKQMVAKKDETSGLELVERMVAVRVDQKGAWTASM